MAPEDEVINPSSLTKFRKLRLKDMNLLDMLIAKTVQIALDKGIIRSKSIIVDATHTKSRYNQKTPRQALQDQSKKLRCTIYEIDETMKDKFPNKNTEDSLEKELEYCKQLISVIKGNEELCSYPKVQEKLNLLEESVSDDMEYLETSKDGDAKIGHKTADTSFFGYKTHIAMTEERIITAATVTSGEKTDGKELPALIQSQFNVSDRCAISGHSMGGHGALIMALKNPGKYTSVSAFAPIVNPCSVPWGIKAFSTYLGEDKNAWLEWDSCALMYASNAQDAIPTLIDQGDNDQFLADLLQPAVLAEAARQKAWPMTLRIQPGYDHSYYFIASFIEDHLRFHAQYLLK